MSACSYDTITDLHGPVMRFCMRDVLNDSDLVTVNYQKKYCILQFKLSMRLGYVGPISNPRKQRKCLRYGFQFTLGEYTMCHVRRSCSVELFLFSVSAFKTGGFGKLA